MNMSDVLKFVVISGWLMLVLSCLVVIFSVAWIAVQYPQQPVSKELLGLAGTAFGFLFGNLPTLIKDMLPKPPPTG